MAKLYPTKSEEEFTKFLVKEYFKHGSVDEVFRKYKYDLPISYANYQRILDKKGVVKAVGPNNKLTEAVDFFTHLAKDNIPFEQLYKRMPPSFQTSASSLYRMLLYIKEGVTRRTGVALVVTPFDNNEKVLVAEDVSTPRIEIGKLFRSLSLPMGFARKRDSRRTNVLRILQQEVFTDKVIESVFPNSFITENIEPFMYLDIADVRVAVYHLQLTKDLSEHKNFKSYKLKNYKFLSTSQILSSEDRFRIGVKDAVKGYKKHLKYLKRNLKVNPLQYKSILNKELATVTVDIEG
jgi:hypothetical protein